MAAQPIERLPTSIDEFDDVSEHDSTREETPPDGGYGWICVAACFTINCFTWGTVSVIMRFLQRSFGYNHFASYTPGSSSPTIRGLAELLF